MIFFPRKPQANVTSQTFFDKQLPCSVPVRETFPKVTKENEFQWYQFSLTFTTC